MEKFAIVKFIGNKNDYECGKNCEEYVYCRDCLKKNICDKEKAFRFINGEEYKAFFLDFCQGVRDVLEIEDASGERLTFVPLEDFQIIDDRYGVLEDRRAIVKCVAEAFDLTLGEEYIALKLSKDKNAYYVLDNSKDCYYYAKEFFVVVEDKDGILSSSKKIKLYFSPEYSVTSFNDKNGASYASYDGFPLSADLVKDLQEFDESIWELLEPISFERRVEIYENGLRLYRRVVEELGDKYEVIQDLDWINPHRN